MGVQRNAGRATLWLAAIMAVGCCFAAGAGAKVITDPVTGQKFGIVPSPAALHAAAKQARTSGLSSPTPTCSTTVDPSCASPLTNPSGNPVQHSEKDYLIFWDPSSQIPASYETGMATFLNDLAASDYSTVHAAGGAIGNPISVDEQYYDTSGPGGAKVFVGNAVQNGGTIIDKDPFPAKSCTDTWKDGSGTSHTFALCLTAGQLEGEVGHYVVSHNLPTGLNVEYFLLTPPNMGSCDSSSTSNPQCAISNYCGWHTALPTSSPILIANMPYLLGTGCDVPLITGQPYLHTSGIDAVTGVFSHELSETMTDPLLNAWRGTGGGSDEIGDKCAYQYAVGQSYYGFAGLPQQNGAYYNSTLHSDNYLLQMEYNNNAGGCTGWNFETQPTATISGPSTTSPGTSNTFSLSNVTTNNNAGVAYVAWYFGDGATGSTTGTATIQHTYARGGQYRVTAIVTDNGGNEVKETKTVTVPAVPSALSAPKITGTAVKGHTLTESHANWTGYPASFTYVYQWKRCTSGTCSSISGATHQTYVLTSADVGHTIVVREKASNTTGPAAAAAASAPTKAVVN